MENVLEMWLRYVEYLSTDIQIYLFKKIALIGFKQGRPCINRYKFEGVINIFFSERRHFYHNVATLKQKMLVFNFLKFSELLDFTNIKKF